jgi:hypothetical protein
MNERIRQLAEQAGYKDLPTVRLAFHGFDKEKFAELIVRECAVLCRWEHEAHAMLEHFGVEE